MKGAKAGVDEDSTDKADVKLGKSNKVALTIEAKAAEEAILHKESKVRRMQI